MPPREQGLRHLPRWAAAVLLLGLALSIQGYQSFEGDQAYRLPLLIHQQDPARFATDPFVQALDQFNPHQGYLALLDSPSRVLGLPATLFGLYALTFALTFVGFDRLARAAWPEAGPAVGSVAVGLLLLTRAGNIGTNHLFGPMLLDRLIAFGMGWCALAALIEQGARGFRLAVPLLAIAAWIHPSLGLQIGAWLGVTWLAWSLLPGTTRIDRVRALAWLPLFAVAAAPAIGFSLMSSDLLLRGMPAGEFRLWSAYVQGPQHLVPSLWRLPQWLAWLAFPALGFLAARDVPRPPPSPSSDSRARIVVSMLVALAGLGLSWVAIEPMGQLKVMLFQPFRIATVVRGLALILLSGRVLALWRAGDLASRVRCAVLAVGLTGDWALVVVALAELAATLAVRLGGGPVVVTLALAGVLLPGLNFLARHDTASGHVPLLVAIAVAVLCAIGSGRRDHRSPRGWTPLRLATALVATWMVPAGALALPLVAPGTRLAAKLAEHCRIVPIPRDDVERLALWARAHTPPGARFVGPPGPKTFRLWSLREVAFNRAASPYHAAGLADWAARFRDHVGYEGTSSSFARDYLRNRQELEQGYDRMSAEQLAALAARQGADHVLARIDLIPAFQASASLVRLHAEGRYALYRVRRESRGNESPVREASNRARAAVWTAARAAPGA